MTQSRTSSPEPLLIDPTMNPLPAPQQALILAILNTAKGSKEFKMGKTYPIHDKEGKLIREVIFSNTLVLRERNAIPGQYVIDVIDREDFLGQGSFGSVQGIKQTLRTALHDSDELIQKKPVRISKIQEAESSSIESRVKLASTTANELRHSSQTAHLHIKQAVYSENKDTSYLVMNRMPGKPLLAYAREFEKPRKIPVSLTYLQRLLLTRELLLSLTEQVHKKDIIHRDIKPQNIMVAFYNQINPVVRFIDFGLTIHEQTHDASKTMKGTPIYMGPEKIMGRRHCKENDYYSLYLSISELWGALTDTDKYSYTMFKHDPYGFNNLRKTTVMGSLFTGIDDIPDKQRSKLKLFFDLLLTLDIDYRKSPTEAIKEINDLIEDYFHDLYPKAKVSVNLAYDVSNSFNALLHDLIAQPTNRSNSEVQNIIHCYIKNLRKAPNTETALNVFFRNSRYLFPIDVKSINDIESHFNSLFAKRAEHEAGVAKCKEIMKSIGKDKQDEKADKLISTMQATINRMASKLATHGNNLQSFEKVNLSLENRLNDFNKLHHTLNKHRLATLMDKVDDPTERPGNIRKLSMFASTGQTAAEPKPYSVSPPMDIVKKSPSSNYSRS